METKVPRRRQYAMTAETIEKLHNARVMSREEVDGAVRVKIVLSKKELKQMVASLGQRQSTGNADCQRKTTMNKQNTEDQFEQMLHVLRKRHARRVAAAASKGSQLSEWQPALQSIPEES